MRVSSPSRPYRHSSPAPPPTSSAVSHQQAPVKHVSHLGLVAGSETSRVAWCTNGLSAEYGLIPQWGLARLLRIAPVSREMILNYVAQHSLALLRSY
jgi:hypothetical protein